MAKILDKSSQKRIMKLRRDRQWVEAEITALADAFLEKEQNQLNAYAAKLNKRLEKAAFDACDKAEYAQFHMDEKLRKFDIRHYLSLRAVNHGCMKKIFRAVKRGEDWKPILQRQQAQLERLAQKRAAYVAKLENQKQAFLAKNPSANKAEYERLKAEADREYAAKVRELDAKFGEQQVRRTQKLNEKLARCDAGLQKLENARSQQLALPEDVLLRVNGLKMYFGGLKAVDDLTFDVKQGEIFGLIGPNGAGKTTVFNCITRFYDVTAGEVYFRNKDGMVVDLRNFAVHDVILQGISRTFQNVELIKEISVLDNLLVACTREYRSGIWVHALGLPGLKKEEQMLKDKAMRILKFMGLENYAGWLAFGLPYGILKKVEIARALMSNAKLIIMDEPAAGLNDSETAELTQLIRRIRDEFHVTILLVEHDMGLVMDVCDTVCAISFGKMLAIGSCGEIKQNKAVQEAYLGVEEDA